MVICASTTAVLLTISIVVVAVVAVIFSYVKPMFAITAAEVAIILAFIQGAIGWGILAFWLCACILAAFITYLLPEAVQKSNAGSMFIATGALAGMFVGLTMKSTAAVIIGSAAGVLFGALVWGNTPGGREMEYPTTTFFNFVLAKGFPLVVIMSSLGVALATTATYTYANL